MKCKFLKALIFLCCTLMILQYSQFLAAKKQDSSRQVTSSAYHTKNQNRAIFNSTQKKEIRKIVHDYLLENPKILVNMTQALQVMREKEMVKMQAETKHLIGKYAKNILDTKNNIAIGNLKGNTIMVEFFDYQCGNCKMMDAAINKVLQANSKLEVIFVPWPFFGPDSVYASKSVLAARQQGKQLELHKALLETKDPLNHAKIDKIAKSLGLEMEKMHKEIETKSIEKIIKNNFILARNLKLIATPAFIFLNRRGNKFDFILGRVSEKELLHAIDNVNH